MVDQIKILDLSDPSSARRVLNQQARLARRWHLWIACYAAAMVYALLHKVIIPLALRLVSTSRVAESQIPVDIFWIVLFGLGVHYQQKISKLVQYFSGATLSFAVVEILRAAFEKNQGWFTVSGFVASVPLLFCTLQLLAFSTSLHRGRVVLAGVATLLVLRIITPRVLWHL